MRTAACWRLTFGSEWWDFSYEIRINLRTYNLEFRIYFSVGTITVLHGTPISTRASIRSTRHLGEYGNQTLGLSTGNKRSERDISQTNCTEHFPQQCRPGLLHEHWCHHQEWRACILGAACYIPGSNNCFSSCDFFIQTISPDLVWFRLHLLALGRSDLSNRYRILDKERRWHWYYNEAGIKQECKCIIISICSLINSCFNSQYLDFYSI